MVASHLGILLLLFHFVSSLAHEAGLGKPDFADSDSTALLQTKNKVKARRSQKADHKLAKTHSPAEVKEPLGKEFVELPAEWLMAAISAVGLGGKHAEELSTVAESLSGRSGVPVAVPFLAMTFLLALAVIIMYIFRGEEEMEPESKGCYVRRKAKDKGDRGSTRSPNKSPPIRDEDEPEDEPASDSDMRGCSAAAPQTSLPADGAQGDVGAQTSATTALDAAASIRMDSLIPPPLCPILVMPTCDTCFAVALSDLELPGDGTDGTGFNIVGHQGMPLLRVTVRPINGGDVHCLEISMIQGYISAQSPRSAPHSTVIPVLDENGEIVGGDVFEIWGANRSFYGKLQPASTPGQPSAQTELSYDVCGKKGQALVQIAMDLNALSVDVMVGFGAMPLCTVSVSDGTFNGKKHLLFHIPPKVDAVLVMSCVLSMLLLRK